MLKIILEKIVALPTEFSSASVLELKSLNLTGELEIFLRAHYSETDKRDFCITSKNKPLAMKIQNEGFSSQGFLALYFKLGNTLENTDLTVLDPLNECPYSAFLINPPPVCRHFIFVFGDSVLEIVSDCELTISKSEVAK